MAARKKREGEPKLPFAASISVDSGIVTSWSPSRRGLSVYHSPGGIPSTAPTGTDGTLTTVTVLVVGGRNSTRFRPSRLA